MRRAALLLLVLAAAGCRRAPTDGPIAVSVIGAPLGTAAAPQDGALDAPAATLALATRQGLVRFDAAGQIVPGLAARWIVSDNGRSLIFRLPDTGSTMTSEAIARRLRMAIASDSRNPLKPLLGAITEIDPVTPQVVDVELNAPRPNILPLFAQAALAMTAPREASGPFRLRGIVRGVATLRQIVPPPADPDDRPPVPAIVRLRGERAATAVIRFREGLTLLVLGGSFADLAVVRAAKLPDERLRFDPVQGLFGLAFVAAKDGLTADPANRAALSMAIDRDRIGRLLAIPGWANATALVPHGTPEIEAPAQPGWAAQSLSDRQANASTQIAAWRAAGHPSAALRVAMPPGPGARLLFAAIAADWRAIGVEAVAVAPDAPADLVLVDEVAPADTAAFYLRRFACDRDVPCTPTGDATLIAARDTPSLTERGVLLTQADALIAATTPFVPLAMPVRWSLVAASLDRYRESPRSIHPLDELRTTR